ncbi:hypothetical protein L6R52_11470 [Myxococcota bacterium]|nr:hypothetical protein [Myxococcota bacterium]
MARASGTEVGRSTSDGGVVVALRFERDEHVDGRREPRFFELMGVRGAERVGEVHTAAPSIEGTHTAAVSPGRAEIVAELDAAHAAERAARSLWLDAGTEAERRIRQNVDRLGVIERSYRSSDVPWAELAVALARDAELSTREAEIVRARALAASAPIRGAAREACVDALDGELASLRAERAALYRAVPAAWALRGVDHVSTPRHEQLAQIRARFSDLRDAGERTIRRLRALDLSYSDLAPVIEDLLAERGLRVAAEAGDGDAARVLDAIATVQHGEGAIEVLESAVVAGVSFVAMFASGPVGLGLAVVGGVAGGVDVVEDLAHARALDDATVAGVPAQPIVDPARAADVMHGAVVGVALTSLDAALTVKGLAELVAAERARRIAARTPIAGDVAAQVRALERHAIERAFGADGPRLVRVFGAESLARAQSIFDLSKLPRAELASLLAKVRSPTELAELCASAERLLAGLPEGLVRYLAKQDRAELLAAKSAIDRELTEGGHAVVRHGPHLTRAELDARIQTTRTPDGSWVQTDAATTFKSFQALLATRERALREMMNVHGLDLTKPPGVGGNPTENPVIMLIDYGKPIANGRIAKGSSTTIPHPAGGLRRGRPRAVEVWASTTDVPPEVTRVRTKVEWDGVRWNVVQHFPAADGLDPSTGRYSRPARSYVRH